MFSRAPCVVLAAARAVRAPVHRRATACPSELRHLGASPPAMAKQKKKKKKKQATTRPRSADWQSLFAQASVAAIVNPRYSVPLHKFTFDAERGVALYAKDRAHVFNLYRTLNRWRVVQLAGAEPNSSLIASAIEAYWRLGLARVALALYGTTPKNVTLRLSTYEALMECAVKARDVDQHHQIIEDMERHGYPPQQSDYELLFATCLRAREPRKGEQVLDKLHSMGADVSLRVYHELTIAACIDSNPGRATQFLDMLIKHEKVSEKDYPLIWRTCETIIRCAIKCWDAGSAVIPVQHLLASQVFMEEGLTISTMHLAAHSGHTELGDAALKMAVMAEYECLAELCNAVVIMYSTAGDLLEAMRAVTQLSKAKFHLDPGAREAVVRLGIQAVSNLRLVLAGLSEAGVPVCDQCASVAFSVYKTAGQADDAYALLRELGSLGLEMKQEYWEAVVEACIHPDRFQYKFAVQTLKEMRSEGFEVTSEIQGTMVKMLVRNDESEKALEVVRRAGDKGNADLHGEAYEVLARALARENKPGEAREVVKLAEAAGKKLPIAAVDYIQRLVAQRGSPLTRLKQQTLSQMRGGEGRDHTSTYRGESKPTSASAGSGPTSASAGSGSASTPGGLRPTPASTSGDVGAAERSRDASGRAGAPAGHGDDDDAAPRVHPAHSSAGQMLAKQDVAAASDEAASA